MSGDTPSDGTQSANPLFAVGELRRALTALQRGTSPQAVERALGWWSTLQGMLTGNLDIGSRTPVGDGPAWATPEVQAGGFASGRWLAGGALREHERAWLIRLGRSDLAEQAARAVEDARAVAQAVEARAAAGANWRDLQPEWERARGAAQAAEAAAAPARTLINEHCISEQGLPELLQRLTEGRYRADTPEATALLVAAWLAVHGHERQARTLIGTIAPWFGTLRFYPVPSLCPPRTGTYCLTTLGDIRARWERLRTGFRAERQRQVLSTCLPFHDRLVTLWLETVDGEAPHLTSRQCDAQIAGGWPCQRFPTGWAERASVLAQEITASGCAALGSRWRPSPRGTFNWLADPLSTAAADPRRLTGREVTRIRCALAQIATHRGLPGSEAHQARRALQRLVADRPLAKHYAAVLSRRTVDDDAQSGLAAERIAELLQPVQAEEDPALSRRALPRPFRRRLGLALQGTLQELVASGIIRSAESLARIVPAVVADCRSAGWSDPVLQRLSGEAYQAFARRRSLLLLNLESQVRRLEIPWVAALEQLRDRPHEAQAATRQALTGLAVLALRTFPETILPNPFVRQVRTLVKDAGLALTLTEELAADIFMGALTPQFLDAAQTAARLLRGSLYARYFAIPYEQVLRMRSEEGHFGRATCPALVRLCEVLAGQSEGVVRQRSPAANGTIIEQQQITTTHNLAQLTAALDLDPLLAPDLVAMVRRCFDQVLERLSQLPEGWQQRLRAVKQMAYAWRQLIFFLSRMPAADQDAFLPWAQDRLGATPERLRNAFAPAMLGLATALRGGTPPLTPTPDRGVRFLGWTTGRHWLLQNLYPLESR